MSARRESEEPAVPKAPPLDPRKISWNPDDLTARGCPACDGRDYTPLVKRPDDLLVATCRRCGMHYLPLIPSERQLSDFYAGYCQSHQFKGGLDDGASAARAAGRRAGGNQLLREIGHRRRLRGSRLLELGCSTGAFLLDARHYGAAVFGVERDRLARGFVSTKLGINCYGDMDEAAAGGPYDIVVALNLVEHLPDPGAWLREVAAVLSPKGLLVLWTPNGGQVDALGPGWVGFRVDLDHLNYFSAKTLGALLLGAGLWAEAVWEFKQAAISGFTSAGARPAGRQTGAARKLLRGAAGRLSRIFRPPPSATWALPEAGGAYTLCIFAGKAAG